jgi:hypothetical protein
MADPEKPSIEWWDRSGTNEGRQRRLVHILFTLLKTDRPTTCNTPNLAVLMTVSHNEKPLTSSRSEISRPLQRPSSETYEGHFIEQNG